MPNRIKIAVAACCFLSTLTPRVFFKCLFFQVVIEESSSSMIVIMSDSQIRDEIDFLVKENPNT